LKFENLKLGQGDYLNILTNGSVLRIDRDFNISQTMYTHSPTHVQFVSDSNGEAEGFRMQIFTFHN